MAPRHAQASMKVLSSSIFLMGTTGLTALLSFLFWALVARLFSAERVGLATSLISAIALISYMSLSGLNSTLIRFPAPSKARNSQITWSFVVVCGAAVVLASGYLLGLPWYGQRLVFIRDSPWLGGMFVAFCACAALNVLTDSVFIGARIPHYNLIVDGIIQGVSKLILPIFLVGLGAVGIVGAMGGGYLVAVIASVALMAWRLGYRPDLKSRGTGLRKYARFSVASYISALLNLLPTLILPLIVLQKLGATEAGYYYIAFQIAGLLTAACGGVGEAMFAEASHDLSKIGEVLKRSAKLMTVISLPAAVIVALGSGLLLSFFGAEYAANARTLLIALSVGIVGVILNTWASNALRVHRRLRAMVISNAVFLIVTVGFAFAFASKGLVWLGWAWDLGNLASGIAAVIYVPWPRRAVAGAEPERELDEADATVRVPEPVGAQAVPWMDDTSTIPMIFPWNRPAWSAKMNGAEREHYPTMQERPRTEPPADAWRAGRGGNEEFHW